MAYNKLWTKAEDLFILEELERHSHKQDFQIAVYLLHHPLLEHRTFNGLHQHVEYLRNGGEVSRV